MPGQFELYQNYPNPFNAGTVIEFDVPTASDVELTIYNVLGQKVTTLVSSNMTAGHHRVEWNAEYAGGRAVTSGVYFYRFQADEFVSVRKLVVLK